MLLQIENTVDVQYRKAYIIVKHFNYEHEGSQKQRRTAWPIFIDEMTDEDREYIKRCQDDKNCEVLLQTVEVPVHNTVARGAFVEGSEGLESVSVSYAKDEEIFETDLPVVVNHV